MNPKFIFFDLDDTLLDHKQAERAALEDVYTHFPMMQATELDQLRHTYHENNKKLWEQYNVGDITREQLQRRRFEYTLRDLQLDPGLFDLVGTYYMSCYQQHWSWVTGASEAYDRIRKKFGIGILTNGFAETQKEKFRKFRFNETATYTIISEEVGVMKPQPGIFEYATNLTGLEAKEILYIGDSYSSDIRGGGQYGWNTAWFTSDGDQDKRRDANFVFDAFDELCKFLNV